VKKLSVRTDDGLVVEMSSTGAVRAVRDRSRGLPLAGPGGFSVEECVPPKAREVDHGRVEGKVVRRGQRLSFSGGIEAAGLELNASIKAGPYVEIAGEVKDLTGRDRALRVRFTLPVRLRGWKWENTAATSRRVEKGKTYPSRKNDFLYLGIKEEGFADEMHDVLPIRVNKLPFSCVSRGDSGLALGLPVHEPRVFLISADENGYHITFSLGVTPITKKFPSGASFKLILYKADPEWGIRSAADRFHSFFASMYRVRLNKHGHCASMTRANVPDKDLKALGYAFQENDYQWTNGELPKNVADAVERNDLTAFHWRGPWYWFHEAPGDITRDAQLALLKAQAEGRARGAHGINNQLCGCPDSLSARAAYNSAVINHEGKLERVFFAYPSYSCWLMPMYMDPDLPKPNRATLALDWQFRYRKLWKKKGFRGPRGVAYDAFGDFSGLRRLNFRRDHIAVSKVPATFDPESGQICLIKMFGDWSWARRHAKLVHGDGGHIMVNANLEYGMMFCGSYFDVIFRENSIADNDEERLSVQRMLLGSKPVCLAGGHWQPQRPAPWAKMAERALLFGMAPGGCKHEEAQKRNAPVLRKIASAGWQNIPYARAKGAWVERFGKKAGRLFFAVRNPGSEKLKTTVEVDAGALGLAAGKCEVSELFSGEIRKATARGSSLRVLVEVDAGRTIVLALK